jgi:hypothetical protein
MLSSIFVHQEVEDAQLVSACQQLDSKGAQSFGEASIEDLERRRLAGLGSEDTCP